MLVFGIVGLVVFPAGIAAWMQDILDKAPTRLVIDTFDVGDTMVPPVDCAAVRRQALEYIAELKQK